MSDRAPEFGWISAKDVGVDRRVQQPLDVKRAEKMAKNFRPEALGSVTISQRENGTMVAMDGQHRIEAAKIHKYAGKVPALIYHGLTLEQEGEMFLLLNSSKIPTPVTKFKVGVVTGDPDMTDINNQLEKHGWMVDSYAANGRITAAAALISIYNGRKVGSKRGQRGDLVSLTIGVITAAWGHEHDGVRAQILLGVAAVLARYENVPGGIDLKRLVEKISNVPARTLLSHGISAKNFVGGTDYAGVARWIVNEYNKNLRMENKKLPDWQWLK